ncbi:ribonuclease YeeF family protein [Sporosarcina sp.]|uniref:ribonuclease YeeF family protein n=1 Tax=Sporosarcina sp. TaxID=49982 RepID=UPI00261BBBE4|nr:LXG domain-containing protein [Sporosarcina sp.]
MKVLDVDLFQEGVEQNVNMLNRLQNEIDSIFLSVEEFVSMDESLKGKGGDAVREFYAECHLPFLLFFKTFQETFIQTLTSMEAALYSFEPVSFGFIRESFLEGEIEYGLTDIARVTESMTDEANSIMDQVADIVSLPHLNDREVSEGVHQAKIKRDDTNTRLYEFDASQTNALSTIEQDLATMEIWLSDIQGLFTSGLTDINFPADQWAALTTGNTLWKDLIARTMPMGSLPTMMNGNASIPIPYGPEQFDGNLICIAPSGDMSDEKVSGSVNTGVEIAQGVGTGLYDVGKDLVTGIWDLFTKPKETIGGMVHAVSHPVETFDYLKTAIVESYERDVTNGDAYSRSHWFSYAIGTTVTSVVGTKGAGAVAKTGLTSTKAAVQKGTIATQNALNSPKLANLFPYGPQMQVAMPGGVPYNVMNGPVVRDQLISQVKMELGVKGGGKETYQHLKDYKNNKYFTRSVEYNAGKDGTGFTYKVYQRGDVNWDMVRTKGAKKGRGFTNAEASAKYGLAPILDDAGSVATLHHSQQKGVGPLYEASTRYHNISNAKRAPLHPYKGKLNPSYPMDETTRGAFQKVDSINYWKIRGKEALGGK